MTLLFECEPGVYESLCPVCGSKRPSIDGDDYRCPACDCRYALLRKGKTALVWMKTLRRNER